MKLAIFLLTISLLWTFAFGRDCFICNTDPGNYNAACAMGTGATKDACPPNPEGGGTQPDSSKFVCTTMVTASSSSSKGKIVRGCLDKSSTDFKKFINAENKFKQSGEIHYSFCNEDTCNNKNPSYIQITTPNLNCYRCMRGTCKEFDKEEEEATPCPSEDEILLGTAKSNYYCTSVITDEKVIRDCTHRSDIDTTKYGNKLNGCNEHKKEGGNVTKYCACNKDKCNSPELGGEVSSAVKTLGLSLAILISIAVLSFLA